MTEEKLDPRAVLPTPEVVDPAATQITYADWMITVGADRGIVNIDLGALDYSLRTPVDVAPRVLVTSRLRCSEDFARRLYAALGQALGIPAPEGSDPSPQVPSPKSMLN